MYLFNHHPASQDGGKFIVFCSELIPHVGEKSPWLRSLTGESGLCPWPRARCLGLQRTCTRPLSRLLTFWQSKTETCDKILFNVSLETEAKSTSEGSHMLSSQQLSCPNTLRLLLNWMNKFKTGFKMSWNYVDREIFIVCSEIITQWTRG